jgi:hypothetical protein
MLFPLETPEASNISSSNELNNWAEDCCTVFNSSIKSLLFLLSALEVMA